jgi:hypothetical protein
MQNPHAVNDVEALGGKRKRENVSLKSNKIAVAEIFGCDFGRQA